MVNTDSPSLDRIAASIDEPTPEPLPDGGANSEPNSEHPDSPHRRRSGSGTPITRPLTESTPVQRRVLVAIEDMDEPSVSRLGLYRHLADQGQTTHLRSIGMAIERFCGCGYLEETTDRDGGPDNRLVILTERGQQALDAFRENPATSMRTTYD